MQRTRRVCRWITFHAHAPIAQAYCWLEYFDPDCTTTHNTFPYHALGTGPDLLPATQSACKPLAAVWLAGAQEPDAGELCPTGNYTAADCPNGSCYAAEPNGCGSRSLAIISDKIVPDNWPAGGAGHATLPGGG